jgi:hypothetical protein
VDECPGSNLSPTVAVAATSHGAFVSRVAHLLNGLQSAGVIPAAQKNAIQSCAGSAAIP